MAEPPGWFHFPGHSHGPDLKLILPGMSGGKRALPRASGRKVNLAKVTGC